MESRILVVSVLEAVPQIDWVQAIVIPIVATVGASFADFVASVVKGLSRGDHRFRIWISQEDDNGNAIPALLQGQTLRSILGRRDVLDIDRMTELDLSSFASVGIDLVLVAFVLDAILSRSGKTMEAFWLGHLFAFISTLWFVMMVYSAGPDEGHAKRRWTSAALIVGFVSVLGCSLAL